MSVRRGLVAAILGYSGAAASGDNWQIRMTVDNQYDAYYGTATATTALIGGDTNWQTVETFNVNNRPPTDYFYVATASDHAGRQGFLGVFDNLTTGGSITTGSAVWEVFPAGQYASQLGLTSPWPRSVMPTQTQVDAAINYATANNLWIAPDGFAGWDNDANTTAPSPYVVDSWAASPWPQTYQTAGIPASAEWIWHDSTVSDPSTGIPDPFRAFNHKEFLVFRIVGVPVPEPTTLGMVLPAAAMLLRRRERTRPDKSTVACS